MCGGKSRRPASPCASTRWGARACAVSTVYSLIASGRQSPALSVFNVLSSQTARHAALSCTGAPPSIFDLSLSLSLSRSRPRSRSRSLSLSLSLLSLGLSRSLSLLSLSLPVSGCAVCRLSVRGERAHRPERALTCRRRLGSLQWRHT